MPSSTVSIQELQMEHLPLMLRLWERSSQQPKFPATILMEKTFGAFDFMPSLCLGYWEDKELLGFVCGVSDIGSKIAGIRLFIVDPVLKVQSVGNKLLGELERRLQTNASAVRVFATAGNYLTPGVDPFNMDFTCFLEVRGYRWVGTAQNLSARTNHLPSQRASSDVALKPVYRLLRGDLHNKDKILQFITEQFPLWIEEVQRSFLNSPPSIHVCETDGNIVGFACSESNNVGTGVLGPAGVHPSHRGQGILKATLRLCVEDLRNFGFDYYTLAWTNPNLNHFFRREFRAERAAIYWIYEKALQ